MDKYVCIINKRKICIMYPGCVKVCIMPIFATHVEGFLFFHLRVDLNIRSCANRKQNWSFLLFYNFCVMNPYSKQWKSSTVQNVSADICGRSQWI